MTKKAIAYIRVSHEEKGKEKISPSQQRESITAFCKSQKWELIDVLSDIGKSAKDLKRPALQKILKDIESGKNKFDVIVVWRLDRLTRKLKDLLKLLEIFEEKGIGFKSVSEPMDTTTGMGRAFIQLIGVFAEWEWHTISERNKAIAKNLKNQKRILGARRLTPFGFKKVNGGRYIRDLKPNGEYQTLKKILNPQRSVSELAKETGMAKSSIYYIRNNPIYKVLI
jgi:site-specific DNA recombinase